VCEERFVKIVEDDLQRISRCVTLQSEALHEKLGKLRADCSDESYPVDFLRGEASARARAVGLALRADGRLVAPRRASGRDRQNDVRAGQAHPAQLRGALPACLRACAAALRARSLPAAASLCARTLTPNTHNRAVWLPQGFLKIAKKHDKWIGLSTRPWMLARLSTASFFHERFDKVRRDTAPSLPAALRAASAA
jgi:hypothetical protein